MYNQNEFEINEHDNVIVTLEEGAEVNYGRLRLITSESGRMLVTDLRNYGDVVEIFGSESLSMEPFDGRANFKLTIQVGDEGLAGTFRCWSVVNEDVDHLCRLFALRTGKRVIVESMARILAAYEGEGYNVIVKSHGLDHFYKDINSIVIEATTWPRIEMTLELAKAILAESIRDELRDHAFGDKELYWRNKYGHLVATGYYGRDSTECSMAGFDAHFSGDEAMELVRLGKLGEVERNDSLDDNE